MLVKTWFDLDSFDFSQSFLIYYFILKRLMKSERKLKILSFLFLEVDNLNEVNLENRLNHHLYYNLQFNGSLNFGNSKCKLILIKAK